MRLNYTQSLGRAGEHLTKRYLQSRGYRIEKQRWHGRYGEIDIIAFDTVSEELVFMEVKTRRSRTYGHALLSLTPAKTARMRLAIERYIAESSYRGNYRVDIVVVNCADTCRLLHLKNASLG